jgi:hypothetical protein
MAITRTPMVDDDGSGTTGTIINNAWKTELYNQIDGITVTPPAWIAVPHSAANFTASTGTWTVDAADQVNYSYSIVNANTIALTFDLRTTSVSASTQFLYLKLPPALAKVVRSTAQTAIAVSNNGTPVTGAMYAQPGANYLYIMLANLGAFAIATNATNVMGTVFVDVTSATAQDAPAPPPPIDTSDPRWHPPVV